MPDADAISRAQEATESAAADFINGEHRAVAVLSPPGAGKSTFVRTTAVTLAEESAVPIVVQTNAQADDLVERLACESPHQVGRLHSQEYRPPVQIRDLPIQFSSSLRDLDGCNIIVAPARKWDYVAGYTATVFRCGIVDEAYQMRSEALFYLAPLMARLLVVGDPGQLDPFTEIDTAHWNGDPNNPVATAMDVLLANHEVPIHRLPVSWRLPPSAAEPVSRAFYPDLPFRAGSLPQERSLQFEASGMGSLADRAIDEAATSGWALVCLPAYHTPASDAEAVQELVNLTRRLLERRGRTYCELSGSDGQPLSADRIVVGVTHRSQRRLVRAALDEQLGPLDVGVEHVSVDTANRIQGREFDVSIVWHPLSGRRDADSFHLESGRLCVLTSRHRHACIVVTRDGLVELLDDHPVAEPYVIGSTDAGAKGWEAHQEMLEHLESHAVA